jgi:formylglycine-generating enzyme required for sulfatase activity
MKEANEIGIHDMSGNVWEWCLDLHNTYSANPVVDPVGASSESFRIIRGGSWSTSSRFCRSADRNSRAPAVAYDTIGFRVVLGPK